MINPSYQEEINNYKSEIEARQRLLCEDLVHHLDQELKQRVSEFSQQMQEMYSDKELSLMWEVYSYEKQQQRGL